MKRILLLVSLLISLVGFSQPVKIVDLPSLTTGFTNNAFVPVTKAGATYKAALNHFVTDTGNQTITGVWNFNEQIDIAEAIDLYPSGRADFAQGKTRLYEDGGGYLANRNIYWEANGDLRNDNNSAWSIGHDGQASFRNIYTEYTEYTDDGYNYNYYDLASSHSTGTVNGDDGIYREWYIGTSGLSFAKSIDFGDTYSSWSINQDGEASIRRINSTYTDIETNYTRYFNGDGNQIVGTGNDNNGNIKTWRFGVDGLQYERSYDGGDTYEGWNINPSGVATLSSATISGLTTSRGISIQNSSDVEVAYISIDGMVSFDNYNIYSDGEGLFTALSFSGGSVSFDGGGITSNGDGVMTLHEIASNSDIWRINSNGSVSFDNGDITSSSDGILYARAFIPDNGASGNFNSAEGYVIIVENGIITSIY